jgi:hypothetical protein
MVAPVPSAMIIRRRWSPFGAARRTAYNDIIHSSGRGAMRRAFLITLLTAALLASGVRACGDLGIPDLGQSVVTWRLGAGESAVLLVLPDGTGAPFTAAHRPDGVLVDATILLTVIDGCGDPVAFFPREDIWLESADLGLVLCAGGSTADRNTDQYGRTDWTQPLRAGGHSQAGCRVLINGMPVISGTPLPLHFNSPDLNGDRAVSLADVPRFAAAYFGPYQFVADLHADGTVNLTDIGVLARTVGAHCP